MAVPVLKNADVRTYPALYRAVRACLMDGQRRIEEEKIRIYWETGRYIQLHVLQNNNRAGYGTRAIESLARDLDVSEAVLKDCRTFAERYTEPPIRHARGELQWTHYRELMRITDEKVRGRLEDAARKNGWTSPELIGQIKAARVTRGDGESPAPSNVASPSRSPSPLISLRGKRFTYKIITPRTPENAALCRVAVDLGFGETRYEEAKVLSAFEAGDVVESVVKGDGAGYSYTGQSGRTAKDLYTYKATVERLVDGDTIWVEIDLGFVPQGRREELRLRGIDCPELGTKAGEEAKRFVQSCLKGVPYIIICSSKNDKWKRYLADVYIPKGKDSDPSTDIYLNQLLLDTGHAVLWEP